MMYYDCPYCDESFRNEQELAKHREDEHPGMPIYWCSACEETFIDYWKGLEHAREKHDCFCDECARDYIHELIYFPEEAKIKLRKLGLQMGELRKQRREILASLKTKAPEPEPDPQQTLSSFNGGVGTQ